MKSKNITCIECEKTIEKVTDKDYKKLDYFYCNNIECSRIGLLTVIFRYNGRLII